MITNASIQPNHGCIPAAPFLVRCALAAILCGGSVAGARADEEDGTAAIAVSTHGLDLVSARGQAELVRRIEVAARRICDDDDTAGLAARRAYESCHDAAIVGAHRQMQVLVADAASAGSTEVADAQP